MKTQTIGCGYVYLRFENTNLREKIAKEWTVASVELTSTVKLKRKIIFNKI
ncbi:MAG: hypothetical protein IPO27_08970 [Bacteroidetes bacterium]|nr:hypothetical protein [Bacteroidota bacterium]